MRVNRWWFRHEANKIGKPIDRTEWDMTPQTYNAYYNGSSVEIVLPAGVFIVPGLPDSLMDDPEETKRGIVAALRPLLDLDFDVLLMAHGAPVPVGGRQVLAAFADSPRTASLA